MICLPSLRKRTFVPTSSDIDDVLGKIDTVIKDLKGQIAACNTFPHKEAVNKWEAQINELTGRTKPPTPPALLLIMKDGKVDPEEWNRKTDDEKQKAWNLLESAFTELRCINRDSLQVGYCYFYLFASLLVLLVIGYLVIHTEAIRIKTQPNLSPQRTADIWIQARIIELRLSTLKEKRKFAEELDRDKPKKAEPDDKKGQPAPPTDLENAQVKNRDERRKVESEIRNAIACLKNLLDGKECPSQPAEKSNEIKESKPLPLPFETSQLLGQASAEAELDDPTMYATYQDFLKHLKADLESFSTAYFWTAQPWRWLELVFWAWMGCMVGLLFYIAGILGQGVFKVEEGPMLWAEILIAPTVVLVVFFLFDLTGIKDFVPNESSLTVNMGIAFIFGFAIRRTVGLLDIIKKRFFPDPSPGSTNPGS